MKKLRNKKTGEIIDIYKGEITIHYDQGRKTIYFKHLEDLDDWEDYEEPKKWYWFIEDNGVIQRSCDYEDLHPTLDKARKEIGNYFSSREEAELALRKLKAAKRLKDKGISFKSKVIGRKLYVEPKAKPQFRTFDEAHEVHKDIKIVFGFEDWEDRA